MRSDMHQRHQSRRADALAKQLSRSVVRMSGASMAPAGHEALDERDLGALVRTVAAFANPRREIRPDSRFATAVTGDLVRSVRQRKLTDGTPLVTALLAAADHLPSTNITAVDKEALDLLVRAAWQQSEDARRPTARQ